jgi:RNA-binding protein
MQAEPPDPPAGALTGRQKRFLKGLAQRLEPVVWVGDGGVGEGVLRALEEALCSHELVKVRMQRPADKRAMAGELADASGAALVGLVGHTVILYRAHPEAPKIELPR